MRSVAVLPRAEIVFDTFHVLPARKRGARRGAPPRILSGGHRHGRAPPRQTLAAAAALENCPRVRVPEILTLTFPEILAP